MGTYVKGLGLVPSVIARVEDSNTARGITVYRPPANPASTQRVVMKRVPREPVLHVSKVKDVVREIFQALSSNLVSTLTSIRNAAQAKINDVRNRGLRIGPFCFYPLQRVFKGSRLVKRENPDA